MPDVTCSVEGCTRPLKCRGWCSTHYQRWYQGYDFDAPYDLRSRPRPFVACSVVGCERQSKGRGLCARHYSKWRLYGDPLAVRSARGKASPAYGTGRSDSSTYIRIWAPDHPLAKKDGYVFEHWLVVWDAGIDPRGMHVHHKNHDKHDNRLENLEVLTARQHRAEHLPPGSLVKNQYGTWVVGTGVRYGK